MRIDEDSVAASVRYVEAVLGTGHYVGRALSGVYAAQRLQGIRLKTSRVRPRTPTMPTRPSGVAATPPGWRGVSIFSVSRPPSMTEAVFPNSLATKILPPEAAASCGKSPTGVSFTISPSGRPTCTSVSARSAGTSTGTGDLEVPGRIRQLYPPEHLAALAVHQREFVGVAEAHRDQAGLRVGCHTLQRVAEIDHLPGGLLLERRRFGGLGRRGRLLWWSVFLLGSALFCGALVLVTLPGGAARQHEQRCREGDQGKLASKRGA